MQLLSPTRPLRRQSLRTGILPQFQSETIVMRFIVDEKFGKLPTMMIRVCENVIIEANCFIDSGM